ncbi:hypothetical protein ACFFSH_40105 [Streptomyces filamentosus]|uniref:Uncharacterized protein n=1 Tax=Streptomyces filamentosus TaxID=67294 RepID=A0A919BYM0_STRFL|nr:hypothetical protein [Streptomyces filamentosus]GHG30882.1 hypothetical protein GCM10017667_80480 [Streptomyces filamentosus]GHG32015.1 hypothetical protein GCM10017667_82440 [Streptomyces filamentosus]
MRRRPWVQREIAASWILIDLRRWRDDHRTRQAITDLATCHALWNLPARQPRKETGQ